uniref:Uncharacterized protein n=1 Tax=Romanomermis culicivorax TaxID=13658 RepID=A0A915IA22_ROMCU
MPASSLGSKGSYCIRRPYFSSSFNLQAFYKKWGRTKICNPHLNIMFDNPWIVANRFNKKYAEHV